MLLSLEVFAFCLFPSQRDDNDWCATNICKCDEELAFQLSEVWSKIDESQIIANGFDHEASCSTIEGNGAGFCANRINSGPDEELCCGEYPMRLPYKTKGGCRSCCGKQIFVQNGSQDCCERTPTLDSFLAPSGTCWTSSFVQPFNIFIFHFHNIVQINKKSFKSDYFSVEFCCLFLKLFSKLKSRLISQVFHLLRIFFGLTVKQMHHECKAKK